ncbi:MAG: indolepyruvate ferredoxin oxidoreductase subunit alpha [Thermoanaerobacteraceae bacterium]
MKKIMMGDEAVARGAYEYGVTFASAYPGTPSTEILENISKYKEIYSEWAPNEKVALEAAIGASIAGARSLAAMKHVGLNVAADPLFTFAYTGVNGGCIVITADDPGMHSSQNEQDNRYYAKFAKIPMVEPSDSQECKDFVGYALDLSEKYDTPVLFRLTTRVSHGKGVVELKERKDIEMKSYKKDISKYVMVPANAQKKHIEVEKRLKVLKEESERSPLNKIEWKSKEIGIITSGISYLYVKEIFDDEVSILKLGMTYPLPEKLIREFAEKVDRLYVVEELEPYIEEYVKSLGINVIGKELIPNIGELNPGIIKKALKGEENEYIELDLNIPGRPPMLCAGCPHRGVFYVLKQKKVPVLGDIGCYTLGAAPPLEAIDTCVCMGASISGAHGFQKANEHNGRKQKIFSVIGDSTFFHSGITGLIDIVYNKGNAVPIILDNRITAMTGHQQNPGTGKTLMGENTQEIDIPKLCEAIGIKNIRVVNPFNIEDVKNAVDEAMTTDETMVIVAKGPCALIPPKPTGECKINQDKCRKCGVCLRIGCPAISKKDGLFNIDPEQCTGCTVCMQVCPFDAIEKVR